MTAQRLVQALEDRLATIYRFPLLTSAVPFLMTEDQIVKQDPATQSPRASVFLSQSEDTLDIGIFIAPSLFAILDQHDPDRELNLENLDAYCVLIEELSHFHLILHRSQDGRGVSHLELEWQGEVDKLLIAGWVMSEQRRESCFRALHRRIFEESSLSADPMYQEASHYAAKYWHRLLPRCETIQHLRTHIVPLLQTTYQAGWRDKVRIIQGL